MKVAFSGHRKYSTEDCSRLEGIVEQLYNEGYDTFMSGMAAGFDLAAAECVIALKKYLPNLKLECVIPFKGHISTLSSADQERYTAICRQADIVTTLASERHPKVYFDRNDYLIESADAMICYYSGKRRSGTGYTVTKGLKKGLRTINLYADGVQIRFFG